MYHGFYGWYAKEELVKSSNAAFEKILSSLYRILRDYGHDRDYSAVDKAN